MMPKVSSKLREGTDMGVSLGLRKALKAAGLPGKAMRQFWWTQYVRLLKATRHTFGCGKRFVWNLWKWPAILCLDSLLLALDSLTYPDCVRQPVIKPIFIIGHPRSGTTMLHRFMNSTGEFACF